MTVAVLLFAQHVRIPNAAAVRADWSLRLTTTPYALGAILLLVCAAALLRQLTWAAAESSVPPAPELSAAPSERVRTSVR